MMIKLWWWRGPTQGSAKAYNRRFESDPQLQFYECFNLNRISNMEDDSDVIAKHLAKAERGHSQIQVEVTITIDGVPGDRTYYVPADRVDRLFNFFNEVYDPQVLTSNLHS